MTVFILFLLSADAVLGEFYKCVDSQGHVTYGNTECESDTQSQELKLPKSPDGINSKHENHTSNPDQEADNDYPYLHSGNNGAIDLNIITEKFRLNSKERTFINNSVTFIHNYYKHVFEFNEDIPVTIRVFGNHNRYISYQKEMAGHVSGAGFYSRRNKEAVVNGARDKKDVIATMIHESSHAIITQKLPWLPLWINEGLAEYFEAMMPKGNKMVIGHQDSRYIHLRYKLSKNQLLSFRKYFSLTDRAWKQRGLAQDEDTRSMAWSIVHYLMSTEHGQQTIAKMLKLMQENPGMSSVKVMNKSYSGGLDRLERDWKRYIRQNPTIHIYNNF